MKPLAWLDPGTPDQPFPPVGNALEEPDGLLAAGGDLSPTRLLNAYRHGIFPWYEAGQPILWWSPDPRAVLFPREFRLHRSLRKTLRQGHFTYTVDEDFDSVIAQCAAPRHGAHGTWITPEMQLAYRRLHRLGHAHSVEIRDAQGRLVGGLYGIALGRVFFGESMFSRETDASKAALAVLAAQLEAWDFAMIDCQQDTAHLRSLGARPLARSDFVTLLSKHCAREGVPGPWKLDAELHPEIWHPGHPRTGETHSGDSGSASR